MRFYDLKISDPVSGNVWKPTRTGDGFELSAGGTTFTSFVNGKTIAGALNIEFDCPVVSFDQPQGNCMITVRGVGLKMLGQAANLNGANFQLSAGMKPGLPLATAAAPYAGPIISGTVFQCFGNWQGTDQSLHLLCYPGGTLQNEQDVSWTWKAGTELASALYLTLNQAFGPSSKNKYRVSVNVGSNLVLPNTE